MNHKNLSCGSFGNVFIERETLPDSETIRLTSPPPALYRYMEEPFYSDFINQGKLRISPLASYREDVPRNRADPNEGVAQQELGAGNVVQWIATDSYSLSFSSVPLAALRNRFGGKCLRVVNVVAFFAKLDHILREELLKEKLAVVASAGNHIAYCDIPNFAFGSAGCAIHQAFIKPHIRAEDNHHYWIESEYRGLWDLGTKNKVLRPIYIECRDLCQFLEPLSDDELLPDKNIPQLRVRVYTMQHQKLWEATDS